jgi:hypothetical protein
LNLTTLVEFFQDGWLTEGLGVAFKLTAGNNEPFLYLNA